MAEDTLEKMFADRLVERQMPPTGTPRRAYMARWQKAELAIYEASQFVEQMGADRRLTEAQNLLGMARNKVADFIDGVTDIRESMILSEVSLKPKPPTPESDFDVELKGHCGQKSRRCTGRN